MSSKDLINQNPNFDKLEMGNLNFTYSSSTKALETPSFFYLGALEKKDVAEKKRLNSYTYAFNGMERDDEVNGAGNSYTTMFRQYDSRTCRWLSIDPYSFVFVSESPYSSMGNNPLYFVDPNGDKIKPSNKKKGEGNSELAPTSGEVWADEEMKEMNQKVFDALSAKTGLNLYINEDGFISYEKDEEGQAIVKSGNFSESARFDLISAIDEEDFSYTLYYFKNSNIVGGARSTLREEGDKKEFMEIDITDFSDEDPDYYDLGTTFLHEMQHGWAGLADVPREVPRKSNDPMAPYYVQGLGRFSTLGSPGPTVDIVNIYRREMGLPERRCYGGQDGYIIFSKVVEKEVRGKVKKYTVYFAHKSPYAIPK